MKSSSILGPMITNPQWAACEVSKTCNNTAYPTISPGYMVTCRASPKMAPSPHLQQANKSCLFKPMIILKQHQPVGCLQEYTARQWHHPPASCTQNHTTWNPEIGMRSFYIADERNKEHTAAGGIASMHEPRSSQQHPQTLAGWRQTLEVGGLKLPLSSGCADANQAGRAYCHCWTADNGPEPPTQNTTGACTGPKRAPL